MYAACTQQGVCLFQSWTYLLKYVSGYLLCCAGLTTVIKTQIMWPFSTPSKYEFIRPLATKWSLSTKQRCNRYAGLTRTHSWIPSGSVQFAQSTLVQNTSRRIG